MSKEREELARKRIIRPHHRDWPSFIVCDMTGHQYWAWIGRFEGEPVHALPPYNPVIDRLVQFVASGGVGSHIAHDLGSLRFGSYLVSHSLGEESPRPAQEIPTDPSAVAHLTLTNVTFAHVEEMVKSLAALKIRNVFIKATLVSGHTVVVRPSEQDVHEDNLKWAREKFTTENVGTALKNIEEHGEVDLTDKIREYRERRPVGPNPNPPYKIVLPLLASEVLDVMFEESLAYPTDDYFGPSLDQLRVTLATEPHQGEEIGKVVVEGQQYVGRMLMAGVLRVTSVIDEQQRKVIIYVPIEFVPGHDYEG